MSPLVQILAAANRPAPAPPQTQVATTPVASIYANNDAQKMEKYKADLAQQNAMWGGLASLAGAGINAFAPGAGSLFTSAAKGSGSVPSIASGYGAGTGGIPFLMF
jgi:hypothetical protein